MVVLDIMTTIDQDMIMILVTIITIIAIITITQVDGKEVVAVVEAAEVETDGIIIMNPINVVDQEAVLQVMMTTTRHHQQKNHHQQHHLGIIILPTNQPTRVIMKTRITNHILVIQVVNHHPKILMGVNVVAAAVVVEVVAVEDLHAVVEEKIVVVVVLPLLIIIEEERLVVEVIEREVVEAVRNEEAAVAAHHHRHHHVVLVEVGVEVEVVIDDLDHPQVNETIHRKINEGGIIMVEIQVVHVQDPGRVVVVDQEVHLLVDLDLVQDLEAITVRERDKGRDDTYLEAIFG